MQGSHKSATMRYLVGLVGFLLVMTADAKVGNSSLLSFCFETEECLLFNTICKTSDYEVRQYASAKWVTTEETSWLMEIAAMRAFKRLFKYIDGANEKGEKITMTAPVLIKMQDRNKMFWQSAVYTMSFLLPSKHQLNPPKPTDDSVHIHEMPSMKVYSTSFGGWLTTGAMNSNANELISDLSSVGAKFRMDFYYGAGYNSPMTLFGRHNEVWFVVVDDPECASSEELQFNPFP